MKIPGPDHPITISPAPGRVIVRFAGQTVADTRRALALKESTYPEVLYVPREDADMAQFVPTDNATYCPSKGDASYFTLRVGETEAANAVWSYAEPYDAVSAIAGHLAFYPSRADAIEHLPGEIPRP